MVRIASPARPAAATSVVASTATDPVTSDAPAVAFGATNGVQLSVPRSISVSDVHCVVTPEDSMKSRNGGLTRPSSTSATTHHVMASAAHSSHHAVNRNHSRFGRWQAHQITAGRQPVSVATALTAPISATASAGLRGQHPHRPPTPAQRQDRPAAAPTAPASSAASPRRSTPSVVSTRGDSANAAAAITREPGVPMPSASATRSSPQKPTVSSSAHHSRWVTQPGSPSMSPSRKKAPCGNR